MDGDGIKKAAGRAPLDRETSRAERETGRLQTGELDGKRFGELLEVAHGTVKRWLLEGLPAKQDGNRVWIDPEKGRAWVADRFRGKKTIAFARRSFVYFAQAECGEIKIGWSADVMRRISEMRKQRRQPVELMACFPGDKPDELRLHEKFSALRVDGEWYADDGSIARFVESLKAA